MKPATSFYPSVTRAAIKTTLALVAVLSVCSCGSRDAPTLTKRQIHRERYSQKTLYLTKDGREFIAPDNAFQAVVHPETKELAYAAWQCNNPDCPGEDKDGRPYLFIWPQPFLIIKEDGTVGYRATDKEDHEELVKSSMIACPACLPNRNKETETPEQYRQYEQWCQRYLLPEAARRLKELDEEERRREEELEHRRKRTAASE